MPMAMAKFSLDFSQDELKPSWKVLTKDLP